MNSWLSSAYGMGDSHHFFMPVGYIAAWVFGIPTGESHALIAGLTGGALIFCSVFGLLSGATLGGNCTPIGASANAAGNGYIRVTEGAGATHTSYVNDISPFPP